MAAGDKINPAQFSDTIIEHLRALIPDILPINCFVFDPFAGPGVKLGKLCVELGVGFSGNDIEKWEGKDRRVRIADSTQAKSYPDAEKVGGYIVVTSVTYNNGVNDHFKPADRSRRLTYRNSLGHELHPHNTGRYSGRGSDKGEQEYWRLHELAIKHWPDVVVVNVKDSIRKGKIYPLGLKWMVLLKKHGYDVETEKVGVTGWRYGENNEARVDWEWVLVGRREGEV